MPVGNITCRVWLSFNGSRTGGLLRPEVDYSSNDGHSGNFGQKRNSVPEA